MLRWSVDVENLILVILFDVLHNPSFKMTKINLYTRKDFKALGIGSLYEK